jgi:hypothetical protein
LDYIKPRRFYPIIPNAKRFCLMVLNHKKSSCSAELFSVLLRIRGARGFEREKMIYLALIAKTLFKGFGTKPFFKIWFRIYWTEPFSHRFSFLRFHDTSLHINRMIILDDEECCLLLFTWNMKTEWIFYWFNLLNLFVCYLF